MTIDIKKLESECSEYGNTYERPVLVYQTESIEDAIKALEAYYSKNNWILGGLPKYYSIIGNLDRPLAVFFFKDKEESLECHPIPASLKSVISFIEGFLEIAEKPSQPDTDGSCEPAILLTSEITSTQYINRWNLSLAVFPAWNVYGK